MAYKKILAAIDLTPEAGEVIDQAVESAVQNDAELSIITVVKPITQVYGGFDVGPDEVRVDGRTVLRAESTAGSFLDRQRLHLTWVPHGEHVFQIAGLAPQDQFERQRKAFDDTVASFRSLNRQDRSQITESRIRVVKAPGGQTVAQLAKRKGSAWSGDEAAVANGMQATTTPPSGEALKLAFKEVYRP